MAQPREGKYTGGERRKYLRLHAATIEYSIIGKAALSETSFAKDIGAGGVCIFISEEMETGTLLSLSIYLPNVEEPIKAKGKVIWKRLSSFLSGQEKKHYDTGVEFLEIDDNDRDA